MNVLSVRAGARSGGVSRILTLSLLGLLGVGSVHAQNDVQTHAGSQLAEARHAVTINVPQFAQLGSARVQVGSAGRVTGRVWLYSNVQSIRATQSVARFGASAKLNPTTPVKADIGSPEYGNSGRIPYRSYNVVHEDRDGASRGRVFVTVTS